MVATSTSTSGTAPFQLPPEIIGRIVEHRANDDSEHPIVALRQANLVCKLWRVATCANPRAWSRIVFARPPVASAPTTGEGSLLLLALFFERSRACPKHVSLRGRVTQDDLVVLRDLVNAFANSIITLTLGLVDDKDLPLNDQVINHIVKLPALQTLDILKVARSRFAVLVLPPMPCIENLKVPSIVIGETQSLSRLNTLKTLRCRGQPRYHLVHLLSAFNGVALPELHSLDMCCQSYISGSQPLEHPVRCASELESLVVRFLDTAIDALRFVRAPNLISLALSVEVFSYLGRGWKRPCVAAAIDAFFQAPVPPLRRLHLDRVDLADVTMLNMLRLLPQLELLALSHARLGKDFVQALSQHNGDTGLNWICPRLMQLSYVSACCLEPTLRARNYASREEDGEMDIGLFEALARARSYRAQNVDDASRSSRIGDHSLLEPLRDLWVERRQLLEVTSEGPCLWSDVEFRFYVWQEEQPEGQPHPMRNAWWAFPA